MEPTCYGSLQVCALRVAELETNGEPAEGLENGYVSEALINVDVGLELSKDTDLEKQNGCGSICQSFFEQGKIKRATAGMALCELDILLASVVVGGSLFERSSTPFGWQAPFIADSVSNGVCLELWTKAWDGSAQATPASLSNAAAYWHWVFPRYRGTLDKMKMEADFLEFALTGNGQENPNMWTDGPFNDWPTEISDGGGITAVVGLFLDDTLPTQTCGFIEVPAQAS